MRKAGRCVNSDRPAPTEAHMNSLEKGSPPMHTADTYTPRELALRLRVSGYTVTILIGRGDLDRYVVRANVAPIGSAA